MLIVWLIIHISYNENFDYSSNLEVKEVNEMKKYAPITNRFFSPKVASPNPFTYHQPKCMLEHLLYGLNSI